MFDAASERQTVGCVCVPSPRDCRIVRLSSTGDLADRSADHLPLLCDAVRVLRIRQPTSRELAQIAREAEHATLTYKHVGATINGDLPSGYVHDDESVLLGTGAGVFEAARSSLQNWAAHRGAGLVMSDGAALEQGTTIALAAPLPIAHAVATCRIVRVVDEANRYGFAYGTLPLHPEEGEEAFLIERTGEDVRFRIVAFSRPRFLAARMARPIARRLQVKALHNYLRAMQRAVT